MRDTLKLLLPGLIPSWAFFKAVEPSPRVEWRLIPPNDVEGGQWTEARQRPQKVTFARMALRLFWNPQWNEALYLVSLAERLAQEASAHSINEIHRLLESELGQAAFAVQGAHVQFRLVFTHRDGSDLVPVVTYVSDPRPIVEKSP